MRIVTLNVGGFIGALLGAGAGMAFECVVYKFEGNAGRRAARLMISGMVLGATGGNALWAAAIGRQPDRARPMNEQGALETVIPYKNGLALAAYYCGVFGLIPVANLVLSPAAIAFGILGVVKEKKTPTAGGMSHAVVGIVLGVVSIPGWLMVRSFVLIPYINQNL